MRKRSLLYRNVITFSRWSRKKYAVMASLGKLIRIGNVRLEVCKLALIKSEKNTNLLLQDLFENNENEQPDDNVILKLINDLFFIEKKTLSVLNEFSEFH